MLKVNMLSSADKVAGQGVASAYHELAKLLFKNASSEVSLSINSLRKNDITHYHTVDFKFFLSTFFPFWTGRRVGYVHFLPETLDGSIVLPRPILTIFKAYLMSFYKRMDQLVVVNPDFIDKLVLLGIDEDKITYIPNFVSKDEWYPLTNSINSKFRHEHDLATERLLILGVGQIQKRKGVDDFIELARRNPNVQFVWAGGFSFGKISDGRSHYQELIANSSANIKFVGILTKDEMLNYYNCADLFLLPSFSELFPMSILESCSCGTPIMLRELDLYHPILAGKYLPAIDLEDMDLKIKKIQNDSSILTEYQQKALEVSDRYSEESLCKTWINFYYEQVKKKVVKTL